MAPCVSSKHSLHNVSTSVHTNPTSVSNSPQACEICQCATRSQDFEGLIADNKLKDALLACEDRDCNIHRRNTCGDKERQNTVIENEDNNNSENSYDRYRCFQTAQKCRTRSREEKLACGICSSPVSCDTCQRASAEVTNRAKHKTVQNLSESLRSKEPQCPNATKTVTESENSSSYLDTKSRHDSGLPLLACARHPDVREEEEAKKSFVPNSVQDADEDQKISMSIISDAKFNASDKSEQCESSAKGANLLKMDACFPAKEVKGSSRDDPTRKVNGLRAGTTGTGAGVYAESREPIQDQKVSSRAVHCCSDCIESLRILLLASQSCIPCSNALVDHAALKGTSSSHNAYCRLSLNRPILFS